MKKVLIGTLLVLSAAVLCSCNSDDPGFGTKATFRKANISGAGMLAIAQGGAATKAEGDITVGPKALYTVSEDGTMVQVSYNVDVEGASGEVAETVKANLIISPGFIFPVGEGWLWLANCWLDVKDGWSNGTIPEGPGRQAISRILNAFNESHHECHGAHYLIRKSDGALFEWTIEAGAPDGMDDGFKQPTFLNGWFHQFGKDLYVKRYGWAYDGGSDHYLYQLKDNGNTLDAVNLLGTNIQCGGIYPAEDCLGVHFQYDGAWPLGIVAPPSFEPVLLSLDLDANNAKNIFMLSIAKKLYLGFNTSEIIKEGDGKETYDREVDKTDFYKLIINGNSSSLGDKICSVEGWVGNDRMISSGETLSWWGGDGAGGSKIFTLDPKAGTVSSRSLPAHYPSNEGDYVDGKGYTIDGTAGFWECDLSKDAAEYVEMDWSSAAGYQIVSGTLQMERFEAASQTLRFKAQIANGTQLFFYTSVTGADRGKIHTTVGSESNAGMVVTTMVRLN